MNDAQLSPHLTEYREKADLEDSKYGTGGTISQCVQHTL